MRSLLDSGLLRSMAAGLAAFIVYGSWAYYINLSYGFEIGIRAGLVQGSYSLALTLSTTLLMEYLLTSFRSVKGQTVLTILITLVITFEPPMQFTGCSVLRKSS